MGRAGRAEDVGDVTRAEVDRELDAEFDHLVAVRRGVAPVAVTLAIHGIIVTFEAS